MTSQSNLCWVDVAPWMLAKFSTTSELVAALTEQVRVVTPRPSLQSLIPGTFFFHWSVDDAAGGHVVIEFVDGQLKVHNNSVGVFTNDPPFDWHLRNLNNFVNINPAWPKSATERSYTVQTEVGTVPLP